MRGHYAALECGMSGPVTQQIAANLARVRAGIRESSRRAGRDPASVRLVAVTKYVGPVEIGALLDAGVADVAESTVQQLVQRAPAWPADLGACPLDVAGQTPRWHMIGHVQTNKVNRLLRHCRIIHSVDSLRLAEKLAHGAAALNCAVDVFIEVNVAGEAAKHGAAQNELPFLAEKVATLPTLQLRGLMAMAPLSGEPERSRPVFARLREELQSLRVRGVVPPTCEHLSMGMTQDYRVAIEEGATFIRVGSALFEGVQVQAPARQSLGTSS